MIVEYIDDHKDQFGVEPICRELQVAPSTYYAAKARPASARSVGDAVLSEVIAAEHAANYGVYGARKMWKHLHRLGHPVGRCRVERLMRAADLHGAVRGRAKRTTIPGKDGTRAGDLVNRAFTATAPNQLWVADFTYVRTWAGFTYVAFIIDVFSRMIVGWKADTTMRADLVTDTLEMAVWSRGRAGVTDLQGLIHHTDAGSQGGFNRSSQHLEFLEVFDGPSAAGSGSGGAPEAEVAGSPEVPARGRGCVLGRDRQGVVAHRGRCCGRRGASGRSAVVP